MDRLDVLLACQDTLQMKMQEKIEAVLNEQDAEKQVFATVTAANIDCCHEWQEGNGRY